MGEHYVRTANLALDIFCNPFDGESPPQHHGVVNELAYRLFVRAAQEGTRPDKLDSTLIANEVREATDFIARFRQHGRAAPLKPGARGTRDAIALASRMTQFFSDHVPQGLILQPRFQGCGWLSECAGDALGAESLYEIKCGARPFRMLDFRQTLIYCALAFASKAPSIEHICLLNPRNGTYFSASLISLCEALSGRSAVDVLGEIVEYVSASTGEYGADVFFSPPGL